MPLPRGQQRKASHWPVLIQDRVSQPRFFADGADVAWAKRISWDAFLPPTRL